MFLYETSWNVVFYLSVYFWIEILFGFLCAGFALTGRENNFSRFGFTFESSTIDCLNKCEILNLFSESDEIECFILLFFYFLQFLHTGAFYINVCARTRIKVK